MNAVQAYFQQTLIRLLSVSRSRSRRWRTLAAVRVGFAFAMALLLAQTLAPPTLHAQFTPQRPILDSLHKRLAAARGDSAQIQALCELSAAYTNYEHDRITAEQYARQALVRARRTTGSHKSYSLIAAFKALGYSYSLHSQPRMADAEQFYEQALRIADSIGDNHAAAYVMRWWILNLKTRFLHRQANDESDSALRQKINVLFTRYERAVQKTNDAKLAFAALALQGEIFRVTGEYDKAIETLLKALEGCRQRGDARREAYCLSGIAVIASKIGDYPRALEYDLAALAIADSLGEYDNKVFRLRTIAELYGKQNNDDKALEYYRQALELSARFARKTEAITVLEDIGTLYQRRRQFDSALSYYNRAYTERLITQALNGVYELLVGSLHRQQGRYAQSLELLQRGWRLHRGINDDYALQFLLELARALDGCGKPDSAIVFAGRALAQADTERKPTLVLEASRLLYELHKCAGRTEQALQSYERYVAARDSVFNLTNATALVTIEARTLLRSKDTEIQLLQRNAELARLREMMIFAGVLALAAITAWLFWLYRTRHRAAQQLRAQNAAIQQQQGKLREQSEEIAHINVALSQTNEELRRTNEDINATNRQLEEANEQRAQLLGIVSHDLRNPLTVIVGNTDMIATTLAKYQPANAEEFAPIRSRLERYAHTISTHSEQMLSLIHDFLDSAAADLGKISLHQESVNISTLVDLATERIKPRAARKQQFINVERPDVCWSTVDAQRMTQVLENLLSNAVKYSALNSIVHVVVQQRNQTIRIAVHDAGPGFTADDKLKAFNFFQRLSARPTAGESSSGVGLAIAKQIIELHGGRIWVESERDNGIAGATFIIELPATPPVQS